ncbi:hypothetical protein TNCV_97331 [Trichonephila clavipes]|nr:hypothetical protein TNCV_97331 [Trichonephila clavipes]
MYMIRPITIHHSSGSGGLEVVYPLRKVAGLSPAGVDRFSGCKNRRHACHVIMWHVKDPLRIDSALILSEKLNHGNKKHPTKA